MLYKEIKEKAKQIDDFIEKNSKSFSIPMKEVDVIIRYLFPACYIKSKGWFKTVFKVCSKGDSVVLKIGKKKSIQADMKAYKKIPHNIRKKYFAKIFWHTKHTILQEYGEDVKPTPAEVEKMKKLALKYGIGDIKDKNIRSFNGKLKIVDFNIKEPGIDKINFIKEYLSVRFS